MGGAGTSGIGEKPQVDCGASPMEAPSASPTLVG